ncbi:MAG TPA: peptide chain release factor N(5)-glutamine methyltransferase, partial [Gemmatimonadales bacterium]|nr:peptide chain release factor N(5)-glutamine methyltransferase [Gemmatimonadales bacterium]
TLLDAAATRLRAAGIEDPRREARRIWNDLEELAGRSPDPDREAEPVPAAAAAFQAAVERRADGEPLAYVTGLAGFRRLTLLVDRRVLIPRPETEGLVELVLARCSTGRVADVGTGSGCIALALADEGRFTLVAGIDRSPHALEVARANRRRTGTPIALVQGDLLEAVATGSLDAVVSNPPYLTEREYRGLDASVREWEPREALASGEDGMGATVQVILDARRVTRRGGWLALEVDASRAPAVAEAATAAGWSEVTVHMDLFDRARFVLARRSEAE